MEPRLRAPAGDEGPVLRSARAGPVRVLLGPYRLVDDVRLPLGAEDLGLEGHVLRLLPGGVEQRCLRARHQRVSSLTSTKPFFGPGTAPLTVRTLSPAR